MPDWQEIVCQRLTPLGLEAKRQEEIVAELSGHLQDLYEDLVRRGKPREEAVQYALRTIADWDELRSEIRSAEQEEDIMDRRVKALWLPGAGTTAVFMALFQFFQPWLPKPHAAWAWHGTFLVLNWQWLLCLPVVGAFAAYWSRRAGGGAVQRALASSSPALGLCGFLAGCLSLVFVHDLPDSLSLRFMALASWGMFLWGVLPALALLLGALPFLKGGQRQPARGV